MGGSSNTGTTTTTSGVPEEYKPLVKKVVTSASTAFDQTPKTPYTGSYFAAPNQTQKDAVAGAVAAAPGMDQGVGGLRGYADDLVSGKYLSPDSNPFVKGMAESATRGATDNFTRSVLPRLNSEAIAQGAYGGSRNGVTAGVLAGETDKNVRDTYANIYGNNYAMERGYQDNAGRLYGQANQLALAPSQTLAAAGDAQYQWDDNLVKEALAKWNELKSAPWNGVSQLTAAVGGSNLGSTSSTGTSVPWWQQGLQAGLSGLGALGSWWG